MIFRTLMTLAVAVVVTVTHFGPTAAAQEPTVTLTIRNHKFEPSEAEVPAGAKIKLVIKNADSTVEEFDSIELHRKKVVPGGQEGTIYIGPLKPGRYEFFGGFNPKSARGQLLVK